MDNFGLENIRVETFLPKIKQYCLFTIAYSIEGAEPFTERLKQLCYIFNLPFYAKSYTYNLVQNIYLYIIIEFLKSP